MNTPLDVVIVGAGPYGLSLAAHLRAQNASFRIFGRPMDIWRNHMPKGMLLKSDGFASNLSDPGSTFTLKKYCDTHKIPYEDTRLPVAIETFVAYASAFQKEKVPDLDPRSITGIEASDGGFVVRTEDGERFTTRRVVLAVGISFFAHMPEEIAALPSHLRSHSSQHTDPAQYQGKRVAVIGAGASAIDLAALMHESGVDVSIVARSTAVRFHDMSGPNGRTLWQKMRNPSSGLGPGWKSRFFTDFPGVFRYFPDDLRVGIVRRHLGPAPGWPMKKRVMGKIPMILGHTVAGAEASNGGVRLALRSRAGVIEEHYANHIVAATGYRPDVRRMSLLSEDLRSKIETLDNAPALSREFQSSVPGVYFIGLAAANSFGPMMRFAYGADYTARKLSAHLRKHAQQ